MVDEKALIEKGWTSDQLYWLQRFNQMIQESGLPLSDTSIRYRREENGQGTSLISLNYSLPDKKGGIMAIVDYPVSTSNEHYFTHLVAIHIKTMHTLWRKETMTKNQLIGWIDGQIWNAQVKLLLTRSLPDPTPAADIQAWGKTFFTSIAIQALSQMMYDNLRVGDIQNAAYATALQVGVEVEDLFDELLK